MTKAIPFALREAFRRNKLVPLLGAGVSISVKDLNSNNIFPSWQELLERGLSELIEQGKNDHAQIAKGQIALSMFQEAADTIYSGLKGSLWHDFLRKVFSCDFNKVDQETLLLPKSIWKLSNRVMSLNYDKVCEHAYGVKELVSFDSTQPIELSTFARNGFDAASIWHIHGRVDNCSSIILTGASYEKLYGENDDFRAALNVMGGVFQTSTVLFIGCSLEDAELLARIDKVHSLFEGDIPSHFALVHASKAAAIRSKLAKLPIEVIEFSDYGWPIIEIIESIYLERQKDPAEALLPQEKILEKTLRAAILIADPVDRRIGNFPILAEIGKQKIHKTYFPFTIASLQDLDGFDYIFIVASMSKGRVVIEDEFMGSERISISSLTDNLGQAEVCGVFIFTDQHTFDDERMISDISANPYPLAVYPMIEKAQINSVFFQIFKKKKIAINPGVILSKGDFEINELNGKSENLHKRTPLPEGLDPHSTRNFTGRKTDIQNISRVLLTLRDSGSVLTIKAAGGIGKTALVQMIAVEAAKRNLFSDGIEFIDCEFVNDYNTILKILSRFFQIDFGKDIKAELRSIPAADHLIILDNVETLLYIPEAQQICELISFLGEFATILVTSRETLKFDNEKVYELRRLTTDEATDLFVKNISPRVLKTEEHRLIREDLIEELLDNNPLAIKLITKTIPLGKDFETLIDELKNDVFGKLDDFIVTTFDALSDTNVERKRSLFASINYSYARLSEKEKRAFEVLSLFPDGVNMELFKKIAQDSRTSKTREEVINNQIKPFLVTDVLLSTLEGKSMIQSNNGHVRLQSLIGKFAEQKLRSRDASELAYIYENFFDYVRKFILFLSDYDDIDTVAAAKVFNSYQKNFIKGVLVCKNVEVAPEIICRYLTKLLNMCVSTSSTEILVKALQEAKLEFSGNEVAELCLKTLTLSARYYSGDFDQALEELQAVLPKEKLLRFPNEKYLEREIALNTTWIYGMEGDALDSVILSDKHNGVNSSYPDTLYQIGCIHPQLMSECDITFFTLEALLSINKLSLEFLDKYLDSLPKKHYVEIIQANYVRVKLVGNSKIDISNMVSTNPYTKGIKSLMLALTVGDFEDRRNNFFEALGNLYHIKYYYVEALLLFCTFLKEHDKPIFEKYWNDGLELAQRYCYRYLNHQYLELKNPTGLVYQEEMYPLPADRDYDTSIKNIINRVKRRDRA